MKNEQVESWYAILQMQNFQGQTSNKKQTTTGLMGAGPDPAPTLSLDPPLYVLTGYGDWQVATHKLILQPKVCFRVIHLMEPQRNVGMAIPRLKCKIKYKSVPPLPVSAALFVV